MDNTISANIEDEQSGTNRKVDVGLQGNNSYTDYRDGDRVQQMEL